LARWCFAWPACTWSSFSTRRGNGTSDTVSEAPSRICAWIDVRAVMDAAEIERADTWEYRMRYLETVFAASAAIERLPGVACLRAASITPPPGHRRGNGRLSSIYRFKLGASGSKLSIVRTVAKHDPLLTHWWGRFFERLVPPGGCHGARSNDQSNRYQVKFYRPLGVPTW